MTTPADCRSLYVHVPLCRQRCGYCDFYSEVLAPGVAVPLVDALLRELDTAADRLAVPVETIFVGGGTPTVLPVEELRRLLDELADYADPARLEFTVEANPATVNDAVAEVLVAAGVNRVSIGAQSFEPRELAVLERIHAAADIAQTVVRCRRQGITNLSLDLIFGVPGQTRATWERTLERALALEPDHLSCYGLTYEPGTRLTAQRDAGQVQPLDEDLEAELFERTRTVLTAAGRPQYEISNYARPGYECRHNLVYWRNEPCVGIGPSAAGFVDEVRYKNVSDLAAYVAAIAAGQSAWAEHERLDPAQRARESAMLGLRLVAGIDRAAFERRFGADPAEMFAEPIRRHVTEGWVAVTATAVRLTEAGQMLANRVMADFLAA